MLWKMDEFGVLTEKYGLKPQGKSAPMAASKRQQQSTKVSNPVTECRVNDGNLDFGAVTKHSDDGFDGNFVGSSFDLESVLGGGLDKGNIDDDIFGGMAGLNSSRKDEFSGVSETKDRGLVVDLLGGFGGSRDEGEVKRSGEDVKPVGDFLGDFDGPDDRLEGMDGKKGREVKRSEEDGGSVGDLLVDFGGSGKKWDERDGGEDEEVEQSRADATKKVGSVGDFLGNFGGLEENFEGADCKAKGGDGVDDLIPGFGGSDNNNVGANVETGQPQRSTFHSNLSAATSTDPFIVFESGPTPGNNAFTDHLDQLGELTSSGSTRPGGLRSPPHSDKVTDSESSLLDDLEDCRRVNNTNKYANFDSGETKEGNSSSAGRFKEAEDAGYGNLPKGDGLESIFDMNYQSSSVPKSKATYPDPMFNADVYSEGGPGASQKTPSGASTDAEKPSSYTNFDHLSSIFGAATVCEEFEEIEGESEERRKARLARFERTRAREARALAEMNQRDCQRQQEQEERCRIAEVMDSEIKHWAMGKEGNMRALLSSLQDVLWSECGWQPVSLTDLITSSSVKKVYYKATLCVHPDKVQQKGASLQQKYIAEKVFDILKEAYNKFNKEELS